MSAKVKVFFKHLKNKTALYLIKIIHLALVFFLNVTSIFARFFMSC